MREVISARLTALVKDGEELLAEISDQNDDDWVDDADVTDHEMWLASAGTLLHAIGGSRSPYFGRFREIVAAQTNPSGVKVFVIRRVYGLLLSTHEEWSQGTLQKVEDMFTAAAFDDLLDEAVLFLENERNVEACVLSVTVLEHAVKRVGSRGCVEDRLVHHYAIGGGDRGHAVGAVVEYVADNRVLEEGCKSGCILSWSATASSAMLRRLLANCTTLNWGP